MLGRGHDHRMKEGQKSIYYLAADSKQAAETAPFTEQLVRKGYEVGSSDAFKRLACFQAPCPSLVLPTVPQSQPGGHGGARPM